MGLFGKKEEVAPVSGSPGGMPPPGMQGNVPSESVQNMRQQGRSNNQIIQELQNQGYNSQQIFDAMNVSEPTNIPGGPIEQGMPGGQEMPAPGGMEPGPAQAMPMAQEMPSPGQEMPAPGGMEPMAEQIVGGDRERIEEMAEAIIDEKWEELVKSINKVIEWKEKMEGRITQVEQELKDTKTSFDQLHNSIIGKINEYDKNIVNVGTEVKAMGKVFEKVMPTFTENISELKRIVGKKK